MNKKKRLQITPSFVISCVALFVAMSGTAVALSGKNSVNSGDIKNGSVKTSDIHDGAVKTPEIGRQAIQQPNIAGQIIGENQLIFHGIDNSNLKDASVNARTLGDINVVKSTTFVGSFTTGHAQCPEGQVLLSGGVQLDGVTNNNGITTTQLVASGPDLSDDAPRTWFAQAASSTGFGSMSVFAVCLK